MKEAIYPTYARPETSGGIIMTPTMNRWKGAGNSRGSLPTMLDSIVRLTTQDNNTASFTTVIKDASPNITAEERAHHLQSLDQYPVVPDMYILTSGLQQQVVEKIVAKTGLEEEIVSSILVGSGYGEQRQGLDIFTHAMALARRTSISTVSLDDDLIAPLNAHTLKNGSLLGVTDTPNSYTLVPGDPLPSSMFTTSTNSLEPLFSPLGKTVGDMRKNIPNFPAHTLWRDTMHQTLERLNGKPQQFIVAHDETSVPLPDTHLIFATTATKVRHPDYRTYRITERALHTEFNPDKAVHAYKSGENILFATTEPDTNVDSAVLARTITAETATLPWWLVTSTRISQENPTQLVQGPYRGDNELLPTLPTIAKKRGNNLAYAAGVSTQFIHTRAETGHRPNLLEQTTASLVGQAVAAIASKRIEFNRRGNPTLNLEGEQVVPNNHIKDIYNKMYDLAQICHSKIQELTSRQTRTHEEGIHLQATTDQYTTTYKAIEHKLAGFDYDTFAVHLRTEIENQLAFFQKVLTATPVILEEVQSMITRGEYPVLAYAPANERGKNYPTHTYTTTRRGTYV